jgi:hypothetical protein
LVTADVRRAAPGGVVLRVHARQLWSADRVGHRTEQQRACPDPPGGEDRSALAVTFAMTRSRTGGSAITSGNPDGRSTRTARNLRIVRTCLPGGDRTGDHRSAPLEHGTIRRPLPPGSSPRRLGQRHASAAA